AVAEVAHDQVAAEPSETRGGERQAPRRVQLAVLRNADEQIPIRVEGVDEAEALAVELISRARALLRVRHEDSRSDRLNPEGRVSCRNLCIDEAAGGRHGRPSSVEDIDAGIVEVRRE